VVGTLYTNLPQSGGSLEIGESQKDDLGDIGKGTGAFDRECERIAAAGERFVHCGRQATREKDYSIHIPTSIGALGAVVKISRPVVYSLYG